MNRVILGVLLLAQRTFATATCTIALPLVSFSFSQADCVGSTFQDGVTDGFSVAMYPEGASCPTRNGFSYARTGVRSDYVYLRNAVGSTASVLNSSLALLSIDEGGYKSITVESWITPISGFYNDIDQTLFSMKALSNNGGPARIAAAVKLTAIQIEYAVDLDAETSVTNSLVFSSFSCAFGNCTTSIRDILYSDTETRPFYLAIGVTTGPIPIYTVYVGSPHLDTLYSYSLSMDDLAASAIPNFQFSSTSILTLMSYPWSYSSNAYGLEGEYRFFAIYNRNFSNDDAYERMLVPLPNSKPAVKSALLTSPQGQNLTIELITAATTYDEEGDPIVSLEITTLPAAGTLYIDNVAVSVAGTRFANTSVLKFKPTTSTDYSITELQTCTAELAYAVFRFKASDPTGTSVVDAPIYICVQNGQDNPISENTTVSDVYLGEKRMFTLITSDPDLRVPGNYTDNIRVRFFETVGTYGRLRRSTTGASCDGYYPEAVSWWYPWHMYQGRATFRFCYEAYSQNASLFGTDIFSYVVRDETNLESAPGYIRATGTNPVEVCPATPPRSVASLPRAASVCVTSGIEYPSIIPVYLQGVDHASAVVGRNRTLTFRVLTLPTHGALYVANGAALGTLVVAVDTVIPDVTNGTTQPNLYYRGDLNYFTRLGSSGYSTDLGTGWDGCVLNEATCRCASAVSPGCPDTFTYEVHVTDPLEIFPTQISPAGTYSVQVENVVSSLPKPSYPTEVKVTLGSPTFVEVRTPVPSLSIQDPDDNAFPVGIQISATTNTLAMALTEEDEARTDWTFQGTCSTPFQVKSGCTTLTFYARPRHINYLLSILLYVSDAPIDATTTTISMLVYKPGPSGVTPSVAEQLEGYPVEWAIEVPVTDDKGGVNSANTIADSLRNGLENIIVTVFTVTLTMFVLCGVCVLFAGGQICIQCGEFIPACCANRLPSCWQLCTACCPSCQQCLHPFRITPKPLDLLPLDDGRWSTPEQAVLLPTADGKKIKFMTRLETTAKKKVED